jgi:large subunit ribosomal protein L5e
VRFLFMPCIISLLGQVLMPVIFLFTPRFKKQFASYLAAGLGSEDMEELYASTYASIREDPSFKPTEKTTDWKAESKKHKTPKLSYDARKEKISQKIAAWKDGQAQIATAASDEEDDDE